MKDKKGIANEMTWVWLQKGHLKRVIASALVEFQTKYFKTNTINTQEIQGTIKKKMTYVKRQKIKQPVI